MKYWLGKNNMAAEEVLLAVENVRFKKTNGRLQLLSDRIIWTADGTDSPKLKYGYSEIKVQRISPESSSKVQLQTVLHNGTSYSFHFTNSSFTGAEKRDRDEVKELLSQLIPAHRNRDLEEKAKFFQDNPNLHQLYKDLVVSGVITSEEFWTNRANGGQTAESQSKTDNTQTIGLSSGFLSDVKPESSGCNELRYNLDAETIEAIFKTYPAVKRKHEETVPSQMTEKEFWTKFFQSHFFHRDRQKSSTDLFLECANHDEQEFLERKLSNFYDRLLDISESSPVSEQGYGQRNNLEDVDPKEKRDNLFRRFNHQSSMVLKTYIKASSSSTATENGDTSEPPVKMSRLREMVSYEDLEEENQQETSVLKIKEKSQFGHVLTVEHNQPDDLHVGSTNGVDDRPYVRQCVLDVTSWQPDLTRTLTADCACEVLTEFSPGGHLMNDMSLNNGNPTSSQSVETELCQHYNAVTELLRHFWSCFPVTSSFLEEKVQRMATCLEKYRNIKLQNFINSLDKPESGEHLSKMIDVAITKYRTLQEKKSNKAQLKQNLLDQ